MTALVLMLVMFIVMCMLVGMFFCYMFVFVPIVRMSRFFVLMLVFMLILVMAAHLSSPPFLNICISLR